MPTEVDARIKEIIPRTHDTKSVRLDIEDAQFKAGQFLCVSLKEEPACKRYLSISSSPTEKRYLEFTKKLTGSDFSRKLSSLKTGDILHIQYPMGKFTLEDNPAEKIAFLSGGIGITPIRSICKYAVDRSSGTDIILVYANRSIRDIVFKDDFSAMQEEYPKLKVAHVLCESEPGFKCTVGLINKHVIKNEVPDFAERKFFICGPPAMVEAMKNILGDELGLTREQVVTENFIGY